MEKGKDLSKREIDILEMSSIEFNQLLLLNKPLEINSYYFEDMEASAKPYVTVLDSRINSFDMFVRPYLIGVADKVSRLDRKVMVLNMQFPDTEAFHNQYEAFVNQYMVEKKLSTVTEEAKLYAFDLLATIYKTNVKSVMCKLTLDEYIEKQKEEAKEKGSSYQKKQQ